MTITSCTSFTMYLKRVSSVHIYSALILCLSFLPPVHIDDQSWPCLGPVNVQDGWPRWPYGQAMFLVRIPLESQNLLRSECKHLKSPLRCFYLLCSTPLPPHHPVLNPTPLHHYTRGLIKLLGSVPPKYFFVNKAFLCSTNSQIQACNPSWRPVTITVVYTCTSLLILCTIRCCARSVWHYPPSAGSKFREPHSLLFSLCEVARGAHYHTHTNVLFPLHSLGSCIIVRQKKHVFKLCFVNYLIC